MEARGDGPVAYWHPFEGVRHGLPATRRPVPGQERETLCGVTISVAERTEVEWLAPTCTACWVLAVGLRDAAAKRGVR